MQDRFKFRVWSKKYNKFIEDNKYPIGSDYQLIITQSGTLIKLGLGDFEDDCEDSYSWATFDNYEQDCIVMQCTGLKDKNGKLIYEGDIVEFYSQSLLDAMSRKGLARRAGQVVWNDEFLKFDVIVGSNAVPNLCKETDDNNFEVIGNIYENKELLNE